MQGEHVFYTTPAMREKVRCTRKLAFWLFVITKFAATMRIASIISTYLNGNILIGHESLLIIQSTHARKICVFEMFNNGLLPCLLTLTITSKNYNMVRVNDEFINSHLV